MNTHSTVVIRMATIHDEELFAKVLPDVFDGDVIAARLRENLADPRHHLAIAVSDGSIVGMAVGIHYTQPDKDPQFFIDEVGVAPDYQRRGIGRGLMEQLLALAAQLGCREAWVATEEDNLPARSLYASLADSQESRAVVYTFSLPRST